MVRREESQGGVGERPRRARSACGTTASSRTRSRPTSPAPTRPSSSRPCATGRTSPVSSSSNARPSTSTSSSSLNAPAGETATRRQLFELKRNWVSASLPDPLSDDQIMKKHSIWISQKDVVIAARIPSHSPCPERKFSFKEN